MPKKWLVKWRLLVVLEATTYTRIYGQQQVLVCSTEPTNVGTTFVAKLYSHKINLLFW